MEYEQIKRYWQDQQVGIKKVQEYLEKSNRSHRWHLDQHYVLCEYVCRGSSVGRIVSRRNYSQRVSLLLIFGEYFRFSKLVTCGHFEYVALNSKKWKILYCRCHKHTVARQYVFGGGGQDSHFAGSASCNKDRWIFCMNPHARVRLAGANSSLWGLKVCLIL